MLLAIKPLDVAFTSAVGAGIVGLASPWIAWLTTRAQLKDARAQRSCTDRRDAYRSILDDLYRGKYYVQDWIDTLTKDHKKTALEIITQYDQLLTERIDDAITRSANVGIVGPEAVMNCHRAFIDAWNAATNPLTPPEQFKGVPDAKLREDVVKRLTDGLAAMNGPMEKLRVACRDDLAE